ncbi:MAG: SDR family NAD(P)-dependent oxidoreductase [Rickettsiaceae bacterium H1]|nr:SDR family NAD(P)-dependent oxidoreductase [Rickettsiaceae bacterium H1]
MLKGKIALITGASSGLGASLAKQFAKEEAHVILLGRDLKKLEAVDDIIKVFGGDPTIISMDLTESEKIASLAASISHRFNKLDILVGNATSMTDLGLLVDHNEESWHHIFNTNLHANWQLIKHFDPLLKLSNAGRAVFVSCDACRLENPSFWGPYMISKVALESMVKIYAAETKHTNIKANLVIPGPIATETHRKAFPGQKLSQLSQPEDIIEIFLKLSSESCKFSGRTYQAQY